jgi:hypothetical protein
MCRACLIYGRGCWNCTAALQEIVQRSATGATLHRLNNLLMALQCACAAENSLTYSEVLKEFIDLLRQKSY